VNWAAEIEKNAMQGDDHFDDDYDKDN